MRPDLSLEGTIRSVLTDAPLAALLIVAAAAGVLAGLGAEVHRIHAWRSGYAAGIRVGLIERDPVADGRAEG